MCFHAKTQPYSPMRAFHNYAITFCTSWLQLRANGKWLSALKSNKCAKRTIFFNSYSNLMQIHLYLCLMCIVCIVFCLFWQMRGERRWGESLSITVQKPTKILLIFFLSKLLSIPVYHDTPLYNFALLWIHASS